MTPCQEESLSLPSGAYSLVGPQTEHAVTDVRSEAFRALIAYVLPLCKLEKRRLLPVEAGQSCTVLHTLGITHNLARE